MHKLATEWPVVGCGLMLGRLLHLISKYLDNRGHSGEWSKNRGHDHKGQGNRYVGKIVEFDVVRPDKTVQPQERSDLPRGPGR